MINFAWAAHKARQEFMDECVRVYKRSLPSECQKCGAACPCEERAGRVLRSSIEDGERLAGALRRINDSLATFDSPTYRTAHAFAGQVLLMRQTVEAALNPHRDRAAPAAPTASPEPTPAGAPVGRVTGEERE